MPVISSLKTYPVHNPGRNRSLVLFDPVPSFPKLLPEHKQLKQFITLSWGSGIRPWILNCRQKSQKSCRL